MRQTKECIPRNTRNDHLTSVRDPYGQQPDLSDLDPLSGFLRYRLHAADPQRQTQGAPERTAYADEYAAFHLGQINQKLGRLIELMERTAENGQKT